MRVFFCCLKINKKTFAKGVYIIVLMYYTIHIVKNRKKEENIMNERYVLKTVTPERIKDLIRATYEGEELMMLDGCEMKIWRDCGRRQVSDDELFHTLDMMVCSMV